MFDFFKAIKFKFALSFILLTLSISITLSFLAVHESTQIVQKEAYDKLTLYVEKNAEDFDSQISTIERENEMLVNFVQDTFQLEKLNDAESYLEEYKKKLAPVIKNMASHTLTSKSAYVFFTPESTKHPKSVWYADLNFDSKVELQEEFPKDYFDGDRIIKEWYYRPIDEQKGIWTNPYMGTVEADQSIQYISYTAPIYVDGKLIGVAGTDYFIKDITDVVTSIKLYETGYAYLMDQDFKVIIHPTLPIGTPVIPILENLNPGISKNILDRSIGQIEYTWTDQQEKILVFYKLKNGWYFGVAPYKSEIFKDVQSLRNFLIVIIVIGTLFAVALGFVFEALINRKTNILTKMQHKLMETEKFASLGYLVNGVAHELNTPLGNSITLSTFIEEEAGKLIKSVEGNNIKKTLLLHSLSEVIDSSKQIFGNLYHAQDIVSTLKNLSSSKTSGYIDDFFIFSSIEESFNSIIQQNPNFKPTLNLHCDRQIHLFGDPHLFSQIMDHLITNSLIHGFTHGDEGIITISVKQVGNAVEMIYQDNGIGIHPDILTNIYVPYFSTKFNKSNRGLGMSIVYNIINGPFAGTLDLTSQPGEGISITMHLNPFNQ